MPLYKYRCLNCDHVFTDLAGHDEQLSCVNCGGDTKRDFPVPAMVFFDRSNGASMSDCHDIAIAEMESNGELSI